MSGVNLPSEGVYRAFNIPVKTSKNLIVKSLCLDRDTVTCRQGLKIVYSTLRT